MNAVNDLLLLCMLFKYRIDKDPIRGGGVTHRKVDVSLRYTKGFLVCCYLGCYMDGNLVQTYEILLMQHLGPL